MEIAAHATTDSDWYKRPVFQKVCSAVVGYQIPIANDLKITSARSAQIDSSSINEESVSKQIPTVKTTTPTMEPVQIVILDSSYLVDHVQLNNKLKETLDAKVLMEMSVQNVLKATIKMLKADVSKLMTTVKLSIKTSKDVLTAMKGGN